MRLAVGADVLRHAGFNPGGLAEGLGPDGLWLSWLCGPRPMLARRFAHRWKGGTAPSPHPAHDRDAFLHGGLAVRRHWDERGPLGLRLSPMVLEASAGLGPVRVRTSGDVAIFWTFVAMPETVKAALVGRSVDAVFDHPVLRGRGYRVIAVEDGVSPAWSLVAHVPRVRWTVPWA